MRTYDTGESVAVVNSGDPVKVIPYDWGLAGPEGAWFVLRPGPDASREEVKAAERCLRDGRDVVRLRVEKGGKHV